MLDIIISTMCPNLHRLAKCHGNFSVSLERIMNQHLSDILRDVLAFVLISECGYYPTSMNEQLNMDHHLVRYPVSKP